MLTLPDIVTITLNDPPNSYDLMIKEFSDKLGKIYGDNENQYLVCAEITGGTPHINTSIILNCIKFFRNKVTFIYKPENSNDIRSLNIAKYILSSYEHENLKQLVERYDFDAIVQNKNYSDTIGKLSLSACYRGNFDFFFYKKEIDKMYDNVPKNMLEILRNDASKLCEKEPNSIFNELYWNTVIMWKRDECANFIGRVWRIMEASLQYSLLEIVGCTWDEMKENSNKKTFENKFRKWAEENKEFLKYLEKQQHIAPNMPMLIACIDFLSERGPNRDKYKNIQKWAQKLRSFATIRNKSIIAHGFCDISKEMIKNTLEDKEEDILIIVRSLIESVGIQLSEENPFDIFKELLININEQYLNETLYV
ncbi:MAG: hypothetical protein ACP5UA_12155 [Candidatus Hydrogenedens sp.]